MATSTIDPKLYEAARTGNISLLEQLLTPDVLPQQQQDDGAVTINIPNGVPSESIRGGCLTGVTCTGDTALHIAAHYGQFEVARRICEVDRSLLTMTNNKLETPLHYAAQSGNPGLVGLFIQLAHEEGDDIVLHEWLRKRNQNGETALYHAVRHEHKLVVEKLMREDPRLAGIPNEQNASPLYLAAVLNSFPLVECLVDLLPEDALHGAYVGPNGQNALHAAALKKKGIVDKVLNKKPELAKDTDTSGRTPLHYAASVNNLAVVEALLERDRTPAYTADSCGLCPLHIAAKLGHLEVMMELLQHCPDSDELLDREGRNFLHLAIEEKRVKLVQHVCKKIKSNSVLNAQDNHGNTPLHLAVVTRDPSVISYLILTKRVHLNWPNRKGLTALDIAYVQAMNSFSVWENLDYAVCQTLYRSGCTHGVYRTCDLVGETTLQEVEEKQKKELENAKSTAKSLSIYSALICAATFASTFAVSDVFINNADLYNTRDSKRDFWLFIILNSAAFMLSASAAAVLVKCALTFLNPTYLNIWLNEGALLVMMAAKCFTMAFIVGSFAILTPVVKYRAIYLLSTCLAEIASAQVLQREGKFLTMTIIRYNGWNALSLAVPNLLPKRPKFSRILFLCEAYLSEGVMLLFLMEVGLRALSESVYRALLMGLSTTLLGLIITVLFYSKDMTRTMYSPY